MLRAERYDKICRVMRERQFATVSELEELLKVSEATIRRDLERLEQEGVIKRTYGGARVGDAGPEVELSFDRRKSSFQEEKRRIGVAAAELVEDGDVIILDAGTTTLEVARNLKSKKNLTVVTNALNIALELGGHPSIQVVLVGGTLYSQTHSVAGPVAERMVRSVHVRKAIMGTGGLTNEGITNSHFDAIPLKKAMMESADEVIIVADSSKFGRPALAAVASLDAVDSVVVDRGLPDEFVRLLKDKSIKVLLA